MPTASYFNICLHLASELVTAFRLPYRFIVMPILFIFLSPSLALSQPNVTVRIWGGPFNDYGYGVALDSLSNSYLVGTTSSFGVGGSDVFLVKYNSSNTLAWQRTWGGRLDDSGKAVAVDPLGNAYITGYSSSFNPGGDAFLLKFNASGSLLWQKNEGGGDGIATGPSGSSYVIQAAWYGGVMVEKFDDSGSLIWDRNWSGIQYASPYFRVAGIASDPSGNVDVVGETYKFSSSYPYSYVSYAFLLHFDASGNLQWQRVWVSKNNAANPTDSANGVAVDSTGNIYVIGTTTGAGLGGFLAPAVTFLSKYNSTGGLLWEKLWYADGEGNQPDSIGLDYSGNIILTGISYPHNYLLKLNPNGILLAQQSISGIGGYLPNLYLANNFTSNVLLATTVSNPPPYTICSSPGGMHSVNVTQKTSNYPVGSPILSPTNLNGNVTRPIANQTLSGANDAAMISYDPQNVGIIPSCSSLAISPLIPLTTITLIAPILIRARRRH